jgi:hypothetical protein
LEPGPGSGSQPVARDECCVFWLALGAHVNGSRFCSGRFCTLQRFSWAHRLLGLSCPEPLPIVLVVMLLFFSEHPDIQECLSCARDKVWSVSEEHRRALGTRLPLAISLRSGGHYVSSNALNQVHISDAIGIDSIEGDELQFEQNDRLGDHSPRFDSRVSSHASIAQWDMKY